MSACMPGAHVQTSDAAGTVQGREVNATAHQAVLLADHSVARQGVGILVDGQLCRTKSGRRAALMASIALLVVQ